LVTGKDVTENVETARGTFTVKFQKYQDSMAIGKLMAFRRNGIPISSFDAVAEKINLVASTLDVVVVDGPEWYTQAKAENENFSFMEVPDDELLELYLKAYSFRTEVREILGKKTKPAPERVPAGRGDEAPVAGGHLKVLPNSTKFRDLNDRQIGLVYEFAMNYTDDILRTSYWKHRDSVRSIDDSDLADIGWSKEEIAGMKGERYGDDPPACPDVPHCPQGRLG
jgi:hypothetical protein